VPPGSGRQAGKADAADADAHQARYGVADGGKHPPYLPISSFIECQLDVCGAKISLGCGWIRIWPWPLGADEMNSLSGRGHAVFEQNTLRQTRQRLLGGDAGHRGEVGFGDMMAGMCQMMQKISIVGKKDQAFAVSIESPHGTEQRLPLKFD
jgi:hypothetical protein